MKQFQRAKYYAKTENQKIPSLGKMLKNSTFL